MSKIENRNLIVTETFDEFALATEHIDFSVEDLVAYVTSLANVFYWLNVESVWGRLGFVWDHIENNQGYGHFVHTTIPFTVIPSLPDGERITAIKSGFLSSVSAPNITVLKSNWENLEHISSVSKNAIMDLTGAPLTEMFTNSKIRRYVDGAEKYFWSCYTLISGSHSLYLKADFSNCGTTKPAYFCIGTSCTLIVDDDNKYLNMPSHMRDTIVDTSAELDYSYEGIINWKGEGPFKLDYVWREIDANSDIVKAYSVPANLLYNNGIFDDRYDIFIQKYGGGYYIFSDSNEFIIPTFVTPSQDYNTFENCKSFVACFNDTKPIKITIDCTFSDIAILRSIIGRYSSGNVLSYTTYYTRGMTSSRGNSWHPVSFIGNVSQIDLYNPYLLVDNGIWPDFDSELAAKVMDNELSALIYNPRFYYKVGKCPYTFDVTNRQYVNITFCDVSDNYSTNNKWSSGTLTLATLHENTEPESYLTPSPSYSGENWNTSSCIVYNIMPTLIGMHRFEMLKIALPHGDTSNSSHTCTVAKIPSVEANRLRLMGVFVFENIKIKATEAIINGIYLEESNTKNIYLYTTNEHNKYILNLNAVYWYNKSDIDLVELESYDDNIVNQSSINLSPSDSYFSPARGYAYKQPFILTSSSLSMSNVGNSESERYFNPSYMFVKSGVNISITHDDSSSTMWGMDTAKKIIHSIKKIGDNTAVGTITLKEWLYDALVADDPDFESYVMNTLGYTLIKRL